MGVALLLFAGLVSGRAPASAAELAALVTEAAGAAPELVRDSLVSPGQSFDLGEEGSVVLAYFQSCVVETIHGGRFTVGTDWSDVVGGEVVRDVYVCQGTTIQAGGDAESGGVYSRSFPVPATTGTTIRTTQPILLVPGIDAGHKVHFTIERLDLTSPSLALDRDGPVLDLVHVKQALVLGGRYKASAEGRTVVFTVVGNPPAAHASTFVRLVVLR